MGGLATDDNLGTTLSALLSGLKVDDYKARHEGLLADLDRLEGAPRIADEDAYRQAVTVKSALSSLTCYVFNANKPDAQIDQAYRAEGAWGKEMVRYNKRLLIKDPETRALARYLLWGWKYRSVDNQRLLAEAQKREILRRGWNTGSQEPNRDLMVIGLQMKVGDNVFSVDHLGREHRQYCHTIGRQAFYCHYDHAGIMGPDWIETLPAIDETYHSTGLGDGKFCARPVGLRRTERRIILQLFS